MTVWDELTTRLSEVRFAAETVFVAIETIVVPPDDTNCACDIRTVKIGPDVKTLRYSLGAGGRKPLSPLFFVRVAGFAASSRKAGGRLARLFALTTARLEDANGKPDTDDAQTVRLTKPGNICRVTAPAMVGIFSVCGENLEEP